MIDGGRLGWVQRNRSRRDRTRRFAQILGDYVERVAGDGGVALAKLAAAINGIVDAEFRTHCRVATLRGRTLYIDVGAPGLVQVMRLQWHTVLSEGLKAKPSGAGVGQIVFRFAPPSGAARPVGVRGLETGARGMGYHSSKPGAGSQVEGGQS